MSNKAKTPIVIDGDLCHQELINHVKPMLSYNEKLDYNAWKSSIKARLKMSMGEMPKEWPLNTVVEYDVQRDGYREMRIVYYSEENCPVPCYLLIPDKVKKPCPVVICLQGHSTGMHISMGVAKFPGDERTLPRNAIALQAVEHGYAALVIEQRGFGERGSTDPKKKWYNSDNYNAVSALLIGRTIIGERVWDISRGIDMLAQFPEIDLNRVVCMGGSGGGTATYYAACLDERIALAAPMFAVSSYRDSIGSIFHCFCNYMPNAFKWFDMGDLACLVAPRKLLVVTGEKDPIFPIKGVLEQYGTIEKVFARVGAADNCKLVVTPDEHRYEPQHVWPALDEMIKSL